MACLRAQHQHLDLLSPSEKIAEQKRAVARETCLADFVKVISVMWNSADEAGFISTSDAQRFLRWVPLTNTQKDQGITTSFAECLRSHSAGDVPETVKAYLDQYRTHLLSLVVGKFQSVIRSGGEGICNVALALNRVMVATCDPATTGEVFPWTSNSGPCKVP